MRKITREAVDAFKARRPFNGGNTGVTVVNGLTVMHLFGNAIAKREEGGVSITHAGWKTSTTKERLNGIPGVSIQQKKGEWYLNGNRWDGRWTWLAVKL